MFNKSRFDRVRRSATPLQLETMEAFANGAISRRVFVHRAAAVGLSAAVLSPILAACDVGGQTQSSSGTSGRNNGRIRIASQRPAGPIDPIAMSDNASYNVASQTLEYLAALSVSGLDIEPGLATAWNSNDTVDEWTFTLRQGVKWHDGKPFTARDVVATMERLVAAGNSAVKGILEPGSVRASGDYKVLFSLASPNGNFPYLVSAFNPQACITPEDYKTGTLLSSRPIGTGAWRLDKYDAATGATYSRNPDWWGGEAALSGVDFVFFDEAGPMVTAYQGGQVDVITQFDQLSGAALLADKGFKLVSTRSSTHRQVFMRTDRGPFQDKRVRQALALSIDRQGMIDSLFKGMAELGNDNVIAPVYPFFAPAPQGPAQRTRDIRAARQLLSAAGVDEVTVNIGGSQRSNIPDMAVLIQSSAREAGFKLTPVIENQTVFYGDRWCGGKGSDPCADAIDLGIIDYTHRPTPDVYVNAALGTGGIWNASHYSSKVLDTAYLDFQRAGDIKGQTAAAATIQNILTEDVPAIVPYFYQTLSGFSSRFKGVYFSPGSLVVVSKATQL